MRPVDRPDSGRRMGADEWGFESVVLVRQKPFWGACWGRRGTWISRRFRATADGEVSESRQRTRWAAGDTGAASDAVPIPARKHGKGILGKGMEAEEWGRGNFWSSFLCLHSFAQSVSATGIQFHVEQDALDGPSACQRTSPRHLFLPSAGNSGFTKAPSTGGFAKLCRIYDRVLQRSGPGFSARPSPNLAALSRNHAIRVSGARPSGRRSVHSQGPFQTTRTRRATHYLVRRKRPSENSFLPDRTHVSAA